MHQRYELTDSKFMTVKDKKIVLTHWERFIKNGFRFEDFTKRLYEHLHLPTAHSQHNSAGKASMLHTSEILRIRSGSSTTSI